MNRRELLSGMAGGFVIASLPVALTQFSEWKVLTPSGHWVYLSRETTELAGPTVVGRMWLRGAEYALGFMDDGENYDNRMKALMHSFNATIYHQDEKAGLTKYRWEDDLSMADAIKRNEEGATYFD